MKNKILIFGGIGLMAVLIIENYVMKFPSMIFITNGGAWQLSLASAIIGVAIGMGLQSSLSSGNKDDDSYDF